MRDSARFSSHTRLSRTALAGVWVSTLALGLAACSGKKGELVLALQTDMSLPEDVERVKIKVTVDGRPEHDATYLLDPNASNSHRIPATFGIVGGEEANANVEIKITALRPDDAGVLEARMVNKTVTTVPEERVAILRVPIQWLCDGRVTTVDEEELDFESDCPVAEDGKEQSCVAGTCVDVDIESKELPDFAPNDVFGGSGAPGGSGQCFPTEDCFDAGFDVVPDVNCDVELPVAEGDFVNFAVVTSGDDGICSVEGCYIPLDKNDLFGWKDFGPVEGDVVHRFQLPPGVCERLNDGTGDAVSVRASTSAACTVTKTSRYPTCGPWSSVGPDGAGPPPPDGDDADGDTYPSVAAGGTDCDDADDSVYPNAPEACDSVDNDCDLAIDDACVTQLPFSHHIDFSVADDFTSTEAYAIYQRFDNLTPLDLDGLTLTFVPNASGDSYTVTTTALDWDESLGTLVAGPSNCDDCFAQQTLSFPFEFYGVSYTSLFVSSNGYLTFGTGDAQYTDSVESFLAGYPRVSAMFDDLDTRGSPGVIDDDIYAFSSASKVVVTYQNIQHYSVTGTSNTFQFVLLADGTIHISYHGIEDLATGSIAGISPGALSTTGCATGLTLCDGTCVNTLTSASDCGACNNACDPGETCSSGTCSAADAGPVPPTQCFFGPPMSDGTTCFHYATTASGFYYALQCDGSTCQCTTVDGVSSTPGTPFSQGTICRSTTDFTELEAALVDNCIPSDITCQTAM